MIHRLSELLLTGIIVVVTYLLWLLFFLLGLLGDERKDR